MEYFVAWEINIEADSPLEAAKQAWNTMKSIDSTANVFEVWDDAGNKTMIDLDEPEHTEGVPA